MSSKSFLFSKHDKLRLVKIKSGMISGNTYWGTYCTDTMARMSNNREVVAVKIDTEISDIKTGLFFNGLMYDEFVPTIGAKVTITDDLYMSDSLLYPFGVNEEMEELRGKTVTIKDVKLECHLDVHYDIKIKEDNGENSWSICMFDWKTYKETAAKTDYKDKEICKVDDKVDCKDENFISKGDHVVFKRDLSYGSLCRVSGRYIDSNLEYYKNIIFVVDHAFSDGVLSLKYSNGDKYKTLLHSDLFDKIDIDSVIDVSVNNYISDNSQFAILKESYIPQKMCITSVKNDVYEDIYKLVELNKKEKEFLEDTDENTVFKVSGFRATYSCTYQVCVSKVGTSFSESMWVTSDIFEEYEPSVLYLDNNITKNNIGSIVKFRKNISLYEYYQHDSEIFYTTDYFKDILDSKFKVVDFSSNHICKCKTILMGDSVGTPMMIPSSFLELDDENDLIILHPPNLKRGNYAKFKKGLIPGIKYINNINKNIETCRDAWSDNSLILKVINSDSIETEFIIDDEKFIFTAPTMFLNLYIPQKSEIKTTKKEIKEENIKKEKNNIKKERGNIVMKNLGLGNVMSKMFGEVGIVKDGSLALTLTGKVAVKRKDGDFVRWDCNGEVMENQGELIFPGSEKFMILMPSTTVEVGDIIKNSNKYYQVLEKKVNGSLKTVNFETGHCTTILKETNLFNMNFYTKVVSFMTGFGGNGVGGDGTQTMNPMMFALLTGDDDKEMNMTELMMLSSMFGGQQAAGMNPMMMLMMLKGDKEEGNSDMMETMMMASMMGGMNGGANPFGNLFGQQPQQIQQPEIIEPEKAEVQNSTSDIEINALRSLTDSQAKALETALEEIKSLKDQMSTKTSTRTTQARKTTK